MKNLILCFLISLCFSCESQGLKPKQNDREYGELQELRTSCLRKKVAIDCAEYASLIETTNPTASSEFRQRACVLGEEASCFDKSVVSKSSIEHNMNLLQSSAEDMFACYYEAAGEVKREEVANGNKDTKSIHINVKLKSSGKVASITVERNQIENAAVNCIRRIINLIEFDPGPRIQNLDYKLTVPKAYL